jgi:hypothetical protein
MREVVAQCLQKDPARRPSARALLEHRFIKSHARDKPYLVKHLLAGERGAAQRRPRSRRACLHGPTRIGV